jgi:hypothetical protein
MNTAGEVFGVRLRMRRAGRRLGSLVGVVGTCAVLGLSAPRGVAAQNAAIDSTDLAELQDRIDALTLELEELRLGSDVVARADSSVLGFGPAASKVYGVPGGVSIGGYGEIVYENYSVTREDDAPSGRMDKVDALRGILYVGYKFDDRFLVNSEMEFEHGATDQTGSVSLEFAYVDYRISDGFGLRGGLLLSPMGLLNELHEPPIFLGARRPQTENRIIPTTWRENGVGVFGETSGVNYRVYLMNGLDGVGGGSSNAGGFAASGLRGGRQKGSNAVAESFAVVGRADYVGVLGLTIGGSAYVGNAGQGRALPGGTTVDARTLIWEGHVDYQARGLELRALVAGATVDQAAELNQLRSLTGAGSIGESLEGGYVQGGYNVLSTLDTTHDLIPFVRYEWINSQAEVPEGFSANPANEGTILTVGASWKPLPQIVGKIDYEVQTNEAETGVNQLNVALGYLF